MDRRRVLGFLGFTAAATVVGAKESSAAPGMPKAPKEPEHHEDDNASMQLPIGSIIELTMVHGDQLMPNWLPCEGQLLAIKDYPELHKVIGVAFGGHAVSFGLPDFRPRYDRERRVPLAFAVDSINSGPPERDFDLNSVSHYTVGRALGNGEYEAVPVFVARRYIRAR